MADARKIIGAASAAIATTGLVALAARRVRGLRTAYHVRAEGDEWTVGTDEPRRVSSRHPTKSDAVEAGRALVEFQRSSRLVVHGPDPAVAGDHECLNAVG